jgi:hypothetical protein
VKAVQAKFNALGLPRLAEDGVEGRQTRRNLSVARFIWNLPGGNTTRLGAAEAQAYLAAPSLPKPRPELTSEITFHLSTQAVFWVKNGVYVAIMAGTSGSPHLWIPERQRYEDHSSPTGRTTLIKQVGNAGWTNSTLYPEKTGPGHMYNKLLVFNGVHASLRLHGSNYILPYPASHGCYRVSVTDITRIWNAWHKGMTFGVIGSTAEGYALAR